MLDSSEKFHLITIHLPCLTLARGLPICHHDNPVPQLDAMTPHELLG